MMNKADVYFRAFWDYRRQTKDDARCKRLRDAARHASPERDKLNAVSSVCIIEEDWVERIYEGLPYIENAIKEERQFIRQQGEVVPIEKAKHISKGSVEHLAKHSELVTREPDENDNIIPDKLYVVEKLSDYAVYENRFLYMLLCYLRDFIELRYSKIIELGNSYRADMEMDKDISIGKRYISFKLSFSEEARQDPFDRFDDRSDKLLKKIEEERSLVSAFLMTPLMKSVSATQMIKPPIVRTNALKMNNNFKNALALYEYVAAYTGDGYHIETKSKCFNPFDETLGDEVAELISLTSFLSYEYGKELYSELLRSYREEENRLAIERIKELHKRIDESGVGANDYMMALETRNAELENMLIELKNAQLRIAELEDTLSESRQKQNELCDEIDALKRESAEKDDRMEEMTELHASELDDVRNQAQNAINEAEAENASRLREKDAECDERIVEFSREADRRMDAIQAQAQNVRDEYSKLVEKNRIIHARLMAHKQMNGTISQEGDFVGEERFSELEREYNALGKLIKKEWKKNKKRIRGRVLWNKTYDDEVKSETTTVNDYDFSEGRFADEERFKTDNEVALENGITVSENITENDKIDGDSEE